MAKRRDKKRLLQGASITRRVDAIPGLDIRSASVLWSGDVQEAMDGEEPLDLTFSAPEWVSALWASGSVEVRTAVRQAQDAAITAAAEYLERVVPLVDREGESETASMLAVTFIHSRHSHDDDGEWRSDPKVHTHVVLPMCQRHDGEIVRPSYELVSSAIDQLDGVYLDALADQLAIAGFEQPLT